MFVLLRNYEEMGYSHLYLEIPNFDALIEKSLIELYYRNVAEGLVDTLYETLPSGEVAIPFDTWLYEKSVMPTSEKAGSIIEQLKSYMDIKDIQDLKIV